MPLGPLKKIALIAALSGELARRDGRQGQQHHRAYARGHGWSRAWMRSCSLPTLRAPPHRLDCCTTPRRFLAARSMAHGFSRARRENLCRWHQSRKHRLRRCRRTGDDDQDRCRSAVQSSRHWREHRTRHRHRNRDCRSRGRWLWRASRRCEQVRDHAHGATRQRNIGTPGAPATVAAPTCSARSRRRPMPCDALPLFRGPQRPEASRSQPPQHGPGRNRRRARRRPRRRTVSSMDDNELKAAMAGARAGANERIELIDADLMPKVIAAELRGYSGDYQPKPKSRLRRCRAPRSRSW